MNIKVTRDQMRRRNKKMKNPCWVIWRDEDLVWHADFDGLMRVELTAETHDELMERISYFEDSAPN